MVTCIIVTPAPHSPPQVPHQLQPLLEAPVLTLALGAEKADEDKSFFRVTYRLQSDQVQQDFQALRYMICMLDRSLYTEVFKRTKSLNSYFVLSVLRASRAFRSPCKEPTQVLTDINLINCAASTVIFFLIYFTCHVSQGQAGKYVVIIY